MSKTITIDDDQAGKGRSRIPPHYKRRAIQRGKR